MIGSKISIYFETQGNSDLHFHTLSTGKWTLQKKKKLNGNYYIQIKTWEIGNWQFRNESIKDPIWEKPMGYTTKLRLYAEELA